MIRLIDQYDLSSIVELEDLFFFGSEKYTGSMLMRMLENNKYRIYKYVEEHSQDIILGYAIVLLNHDFIELEKICVCRDQWRTGIAKQLLKHIYEAHDGAILTEVRESNTNAIALYESFGMELISKRMNYYSDGETSLIYKKNQRV